MNTLLKSLAAAALIAVIWAAGSVWLTNVRAEEMASLERAQRDMRAWIATHGPELRAACVRRHDC